jgi:hypothetical protein
MGRLCTVCSHPRRIEIERAIIGHQPFTEIERSYGVKRMAAVRHLDSGHMAAGLAAARREQQLTAESLTAALKEELELTRASRNRLLAGQRDVDAARVSAVRGRLIELGLRSLGEIADITVNIEQQPEFVELVGLVRAVLEPWPDARQALTRALADHGRQNLTRH